MTKNQQKYNVSKYVSVGDLRNFRPVPSRTTSQSYSSYQETIATGGAEFYAQAGGIYYKYHVFIDTGIFDFNVINAGTYGTKFDVLVVSAGGAGGSGRISSFAYGGGGGSGEAKVWNSVPLSVGLHKVEVGSGGVVNPGSNGGNGGNSSLDKVFLCIGGEGGKANGIGGKSGNQNPGGTTVSGVNGGGGGGSFRTAGYEAGVYYVNSFYNTQYTSPNAGGLGGSGLSYQEFGNVLNLVYKFNYSPPFYSLPYTFCFGGGGAALYDEARAAEYYDALTGIYVGSYDASPGATVDYGMQSYPAYGKGSGGGGGGESPGSGVAEASNGTDGFVIVRYPINPSFRMPVTITSNPLDTVAFEEGLPISSSYFSSYSYPEGVTYSVTSGSLPTGISLTAEGTLSGTPTVANQSYSFTVTATNGYSSVSISKSGTVTPFVLTSVTGAFSDTTSSGVRTIVWRGTGSMNIASGGKNMEVLVVGGGGGGGYDCGGGGGGGVVYYSTSKAITKGSNSIVVGAGGAQSGSPSARSANGGLSQLGDIYASGGGSGGKWASSYGAYPGGGGGSWGGSGGSAQTGTNLYSSAGGNATPYYQLPDGGYYFAMGGGGGATSAGSMGTTYTQSTTLYGTGGNGGTGKLVFGTVYADGGGGGGDAGLTRTQSTGGSGNGGRGQTNGSSTSINAVANTGSGGGGSTNSGIVTMVAGNGSAGVVIVRFTV